MNRGDGNNKPLIDRFRARISDLPFPCVGAKSALARQQMTFVVAGDMRCPRHDAAVYQALRDFVVAYGKHSAPFQSLVVIYPTDDEMSEEQFEEAMWQRLQAMEDRDALEGRPYDPRVSADVSDPKFSLSFAGEAFFVVGLHRGASRPARRFDHPTLVFNPHGQFEHLRATNRYEKLRETIIRRDIAFAGTANPMLARHGEISEARQYSGRAVGPEWACPLKMAHLQMPRG